MDIINRDTVPVDEETGSSQRRRSRDSLFLMANLRLEGETILREVRIRNLSAGGLMAELDRIVEPGSAVWMAIRGIGEINGKVAWCTEGRVGITLDTPIDPKLARKPVGIGGQTPLYAKAPIFTRTR